MRWGILSTFARKGGVAVGKKAAEAGRRIYSSSFWGDIGGRRM